MIRSLAPVSARPHIVGLSPSSSPSTAMTKVTATASKRKRSGPREIKYLALWHDHGIPLGKRPRMPVDYDEGKSDEDEEHIKKKPRQSLSSPSPSKVTHKIAKKVGRYKGKSVEQYDLAIGAMIAQFDSAKDAGLTLKINPAAISNCARGKPHCNSARGYGW